MPVAQDLSPALGIRRPFSDLVQGTIFRLRSKLPPSQMLRRTAVASAKAGRRTTVALAERGQTVPQHVPESDNLELHPAEDARYDEVEVAPAIGWNPEADAAEPPTVAAALPSGAGDGLRTARGEPDEPARSVMAPVAAAMLVGLALGFAGGYALGGRRGTPAVASAPAATAPSGPADVAAPPGREFTEAAVGDPDTVQPKPAPGERPDATSEKDTPRTAAAPVTAPGRLLVRSTPTGARVFVDGREQGQTPATIRELSPGTHRVRIARDGYVAEERRIAITTAQPIQSMTVDLRRTGAAATARSTGSPPRAARDRRRVGRSAHRRLAAGRRQSVSRWQTGRHHAALAAANRGGRACGSPGTRRVSSLVVIGSRGGRPAPACGGIVGEMRSMRCRLHACATRMPNAHQRSERASAP